MAPETRAIELVVRFEILDPEPAVAYSIDGTFLYRPAAFAGMTHNQIRQAIVVDGIAGNPSLRSVGQALLAQWNSMATLRALPIPFTFNP